MSEHRHWIDEFAIAFNIYCDENALTAEDGTDLAQEIWMALDRVAEERWDQDNVQRRGEAA